MTIKVFSTIGLLVSLCVFSATSFAHQSEQKALDKACEDARQIALKPLREDIYKECLQDGKSKSECKSNAAAYNGNRINGAPRFYELPPCVKAFEFRNDHKN